MKKIYSFILALVLCFSAIIPVSAYSANATEQWNFDIENYIQYTINFVDSRFNSRNTSDNIDTAIEYVESLNLSNMGYSYLEEACVNELEGYRDDDIVLQRYTVLVPNTREKHYFGTYLNYDYYYEYTSVSDMRRETDGEEKNSSNASEWNSWILGIMDLAMCWSSQEWSVPYAIIRNVTGVSGTVDVHNGSYNQYVEQFTNTVTRTIFKERSSNNYDACYQDQTSSLRIKRYFCPVGTAFSSDYIEIGTDFNGSVSANNLTTTEILQAANVYSNHGGEIIYRVSYHRVTEDWGN